MKNSRSFAPPTLYSYASCDTCRRATRWLTSHGIHFVEKPIRETPPGKADLRRGLEAVRGDYRKIFNTSGRDYRAHSIGELLPTLNEAQVLDRLASNGNLIKRPFLVTDRFVLVGFNETAWAAAFAGA